MKAFEKFAGLSMIVFPILLLIGFIMHPDLLSFKIVTTAEDLANNFRHQTIFHIGHLIVALAIPFIIVSNIYIMLLVSGPYSMWGFVGGVTALFGAVILGLDKGSLCLVLSAFDTLDQSQFEAFTPYLQLLVDKRGLLVINWLIILLPLGTILQTVGLVKAKYISKSIGVLMGIGLLLLNNPDIEIISTLGVLLMMTGFIPLGMRVLKEKLIS